MRIVLMYSTHQPSADHLSRLAQFDPSVEVVVANDEPHAIDICQQAHVILGHRYLRQVLPTVGSLKIVQSTAGGVDQLPLDLLAQKGIRLLRCTIASPMIARHAVTCAWAIARQLHRARDHQHERQWNPDFDWPRQPRNALVVGAGSIGRAIAGLLQREGIRVVGVRGSSSSEPLEGFDRVYGPEALTGLLPGCDWCFISMPLTAQTHGLFDHDKLRLLPHRSVLVNVARGEVLDIDALCALVEQGHLLGAALDVLSPYEKNPDHPVWSTPGILLTPHVASHFAERAEQIEAFAEQQVRAYLLGQPMIDEVKLDRMGGVA